MIKDIDSFLQKYTSVMKDQGYIYTNDGDVEYLKWMELDFNTRDILDQLDNTDNFILYGTIKKAYDIIKTYQRMFMIYKHGRGDYYNFASHENKKDIEIVTNIINKLQQVSDALHNKYMGVVQSGNSAQ